MMTADECMFWQGEGCVFEIQTGQRCPHTTKDIIFQCTASNDDLVDGCILCESREADAGFPFEEYCKKCAEEAKGDE